MLIYFSITFLISVNISRSNGEEQFVVHRNRSVLTLNSMLNASNGDSSYNVAAGIPTHWEDTRKQSYAGRRSRRNSFSEDSQVCKLSIFVKSL